MEQIEKKQLELSENKTNFKHTVKKMFLQASSSVK